MTTFSTPTLALDCAVRNVTVCVVDRYEIKASYHEHECVGTQSQVLLMAIDRVLTAARLKLAAIENVLYVRGPGSFTALRVGLATLKGLFTSETHFFTVSSLLCRFFSQEKEDAIAMIPMGRSYVAIGRWEGNAFSERLIDSEEFSQLKKTTPSLITNSLPQSFLKIIERGCCVPAALDTVSLNYLVPPRSVK